MILDDGVEDIAEWRGLRLLVQHKRAGRPPVFRDEAVQILVPEEAAGKGSAILIQARPAGRERPFLLAEVSREALPQRVPVVPGQQEVLCQIPELDLAPISETLACRYHLRPRPLGAYRRVEIVVELPHLLGPVPKCPHRVKHRNASANR
jgi:hypothetical protein